MFHASLPPLAVRFTLSLEVNDVVVVLVRTFKGGCAIGFVVAKAGS
ncbi:MAG: hypothetical protein U0176_08635 [Bacteroidia bacterium]